MDSFNMCQRTALISQRKHKWVSREEKAAARWIDGSGLPRLKLLVLIMYSFQDNRPNRERVWSQ